MLLALAVPLAVIVWKSEFVRQPVTTGIAVLPFENLSDEKEHAFFADGVQDDILTKLAKIADLKVISRTSVTQYRGKQNAREIGDALRVSHVLEGSVRRDGARIHLNAQLIDTRTDTHVWAEEYDRDLSQMFALQSEIAQKVAERLHAKISASEKLAVERKPTADLTAFDLYTRAKNILVTAGDRTKAELLEAVDLLNQAVARDPSFFDAYCQLADGHDTHLYRLTMIIHPRVWLLLRQPSRRRLDFVPMRVKRTLRVRKIFIWDIAIMTMRCPNWKLRVRPCLMTSAYPGLLGHHSEASGALGRIHAKSRARGGAQPARLGNKKGDCNELYLFAALC